MIRLYVIFVFLGLLLVSCSNEQQSPVSPTDQSSLGKHINREFTGTNTLVDVIIPAVITYPDGKMKIRGNISSTEFVAAYLPGDTDPDILSGPGEVEINGLIDPITLVGQWQGNFELTPEEAGGGEWQFTWHGTSEYSPTGWQGGPGIIIPLQEIGHGEGGDISGMQCRMEVIIHSALDFSDWYGEVTGVITSH